MTSLLAVSEARTWHTAAVRLLSEEERSAVIDAIAADPEAGAVMRGTGGVRKLRIGLRGRGKRGGGRVIYWYHSQDYPAVLLFVYAKNEADDLSSEQRNAFARITAGFIGDFGGRK